MINLGIIGATGKMGKEIISLAQKEPNIKSIIGFSKENETNNEIPTFCSFEDLNPVNIIIDFSTHSLIPEIISFSLQKNIPIVIGTTGFTESELDLIYNASKNLPILLSPNMSIGLNKLALILEYANTIFDTHDISILDIHHKYKLDAPSGTAKWLANIIALPNEKISSIRVGDVIGEHTITFGLDKEIINISHKAIDRSIFATGAITAMKWLIDKPAGLYSIKDIFKP